MKIALAQINTKIGAISENKDKVIKFIEKGIEDKVDLIIFPELTINGYPPQDLLENKDFIEKTDFALNEIAKKTKNISVIIGFAEKNKSGIGKTLYNSAALLENEKIKFISRKSLLPTYDIFDEARHFEPAENLDIVSFKNYKLGITICEDIWNDNEFNFVNNYKNDPLEIYFKKGMDFIINISASPYEVGKWNQREKILSKKAKKYNTPIIYVNLIGGNDSVLFDGLSMVFNEKGEKIAQASDFKEEILIFDFKEKPVYNPVSQCEEESIFKALCMGIKDYCEKCGFKKVIIGLSGGIDSALTAVLATYALGSENVYGISMPTKYSSEGSFQDSEKLTKNLGIKYDIISIQDIFDLYLSKLNPFFAEFSEDITEENIQSRIRGDILMAFSNKYNSLVLATGNKSEIAVGYCTLYGDTCGGLAPISDLPKMMVYKLSRYINREKEIIPLNIIEKEPSAELKPNQKDQDSLPPYDILDKILELYVEDKKTIEEITNMGYNKELVHNIIKKVDIAEYKRKQLPLGLKISNKSFGIGRRMPIARGWF